MIQVQMPGTGLVPNTASGAGGFFNLAILTLTVNVFIRIFHP